MAGILVEGDGIEWPIAVASYAQQFFSVQERMKRRPEGAVPGESLPSATIAEFLTYLKGKLGQDQWPKVMRVLRVLDTMATTGILLDTGGELFNRSYITADVGTRTQKKGWLHLSEVLGAALIIPIYGAITIPITGTNRETGNRDIGFGLVLNNRYVLTNTHVIRDIELDGEIPTPKETPPGMVDWRAMPETIKVANAYARPDDHLDVGIIEIEVGDGAPGLS